MDQMAPEDRALARSQEKLRRQDLLRQAIQRGKELQASNKDDPFTFKRYVSRVMNGIGLDADHH